MTPYFPWFQQIGLKKKYATFSMRSAVSTEMPLQQSISAYQSLKAKGLSASIAPTVPCPTCGRFLQSRASLGGHMRVHHPRQHSVYKLWRTWSLSKKKDAYHFNGIGLGTLNCCNSFSVIDRYWLLFLLRVLYAVVRYHNLMPMWRFDRSGGKQTLTRSRLSGP